MPDKPRLKIAIGSYGHTRALKAGDVPIRNVEPDFVEVVPIIGAFRRMVRDVEFDVCEMAPTTYMIARALGAPFIALPMFVMRRFHHGGFVVRPDSGIKVPKDLEGKKVGVRAYSVTTGVWTRGIFVNEYGLDSSKVTWVVDDEEHVTALKLPPNVVHAPEGKSLVEHDGERRAAGRLHRPRRHRPRRPADRRLGERAGRPAPRVYPELIANVAQVEADWFRRTGIYPIHGLIVVKTEVLAKHPVGAQGAVRCVRRGQEALHRPPQGQRRQLGRRPEVPRPHAARRRSAALWPQGQHAEHRGDADLWPAAGAHPQAHAARTRCSSIPTRRDRAAPYPFQPRRRSACRPSSISTRMSSRPTPRRYPLNPLGGNQSTWSRDRPTPFEKLVEAMDQAGVAKAAIVQASTAYGHDNSYVADAIAAHPRALHRRVLGRRAGA